MTRTGPLRALALRLSSSLLTRRNPQQDQDLEAELESHIQMHTDDNIRAGMKPEDARREAIIKLGGIEPAKESYRDRRGIPILENLIQDVRFTLRQMRKNLGFTVVAVLILALGMCASVSIFAFVDAALLQPLPYQDSYRLAGVFEKTTTCDRCNLSYPDFVDWKKMNTVLQSLEAYNPNQILLRTESGVEPVNGARVSSGFFRTLGVRPILGRDFHNEEDSIAAPITALVSYDTWQKRYGGDSKILGQAVRLGDEAVTIIGVLPQSFHFAPIAKAEYWKIMHAISNCEKRRSCHGIYGIGRLKDGVSIEAANTSIAGLAQQLEKEYPESNRGQGGMIVPLADLISGPVRPILLALLAGSCLLMVIVWANVASLLLVRSESRKKELAVRRAMGASTSRLFGQFIVEGLVLVVFGSTIGVVSGIWLMRWLVSLIPTFMMDFMPFLSGLGPNLRVMLFAAGVALIAATLFTLTPAIHLAMSKTRDGLVEGARGSAGMAWQRIGSKLVVAELATAVILLVGAGLLGKSLYLLLNVSLGFTPELLLTTQLAAPGKTYDTDPKQIAVERLIATRLSNLPGVKSVGISSQLPVTHNGNTTWIRIVGKPYNGEHNDVPERAVSADYFTTIGAKLKSGRYFEESEDASKPPVAIINETFARQYFPGEDPIGKQISYVSQPPPPPMQVVGVIQDLHEGQLDKDNRSVLYLPFNQNTSSFMALTIRTADAGSESSLMSAIESEIRQINPEIAILKSGKMTKQIENSPTAYMRRSSAWLVGAFAASALLLCIVGLYGVVAYSVSQRTREIGVRIALGAAQGSIYKMILMEAGWLTSVGLVIGLASAVGLARFLEGLLFGVSSWDAITLVGVAIVLGTASVAASFVPAHRAASVSPVEALRSE